MPDKPQWQIDDEEYIAGQRAKAAAFRLQATEASGPKHTERLDAEADLAEQEAEAAQRLLDARVGGDRDAINRAAEDIRELRTFWREIRDLRTSGYLHVFADIAADLEG